MAIARVARIWFNGRLAPWAEATVHVLSHVVHYGSSFFEGIRCYQTPRGPAIFRLAAHMRRLADSAQIYRAETPYSLEQLVAAVKETVRANGLRAGYIRPVVFRGYGEIGVNPANNPVEVAIATVEWGKYLGAGARAGHPPRDAVRGRRAVLHRRFFALVQGEAEDTRGWLEYAE